MRELKQPRPRDPNLVLADSSFQYPVIHVYIYTLVWEMLKWLGRET